MSTIRILSTSKAIPCVTTWPSDRGKNETLRGSWRAISINIAIYFNTNIVATNRCKSEMRTVVVAHARRAGRRVKKGITTRIIVRAIMIR